MSGECGGCGCGGGVIGLEAAVVTRLILCSGGGGTWRVLEGPPTPTPPTPPPPIPGPGGGGRSGMRRCGGGVPPAASDWASEWRIVKYQ